MSKSWVTISICPWCKKEGPILLDRRMKESFEGMHTEDSVPCEECAKTKSVLLYDSESKKFLAYIKKEAVLNAEALKKFEGTSVKMLGRVPSERRIFRRFKKGLEV